MNKNEVMQMALEVLQEAKASYWTQKLQNTIEALKAALAQPEKEWVGLTDEEREEICFGNEIITFATEAKLKEKNGY